MTISRGKISNQISKPKNKKKKKKTIYKRRKS